MSMQVAIVGGGHPFGRLVDLISPGELRAISQRYPQISGFAPGR
jgi:hypothetical protein